MLVGLLREARRCVMCGAGTLGRVLAFHGMGDDVLAPAALGSVRHAPRSVPSGIAPGLCALMDLPLPLCSMKTMELQRRQHQDL